MSTPPAQDSPLKPAQDAWSKGERWKALCLAWEVKDPARRTTDLPAGLGEFVLRACRQAVERGRGEDHAAVPAQLGRLLGPEFKPPRCLVRARVANEPPGDEEHRRALLKAHLTAARKLMEAGNWLPQQPPVSSVDLQRLAGELAAECKDVARSSVGNQGTQRLAGEFAAECKGFPAGFFLDLLEQLLGVGCRRTEWINVLLVPPAGKGELAQVRLDLVPARPGSGWNIFPDAAQAFVIRDKDFQDSEKAALDAAMVLTGCTAEFAQPYDVRWHLLVPGSEDRQLPLARLTGNSAGLALALGIARMLALELLGDPAPATP
jgi:hypothetical protein